MKRTLKDYFLEREMKRTGGMPENAPFHSKSYRRYFEGYSEYRRTLPDGKKKIERVYTGVYHTLEATDSQRKMLKTGYTLLYALSAALFLFSASRYLPGNTVWYVTFPEAAGIALLFLLLTALSSYLTAPKDMTLYEYRSVGFLKKTSASACADLFLLALIRVVYACVHRGENYGWEMGCALMCLGAAVCCLVICLSENRNTYMTHVSDAVVPDDAHQIHL